jgi:hypothetical protein
MQPERKRADVQRHRAAGAQVDGEGLVFGEADGLPRGSALSVHRTLRISTTNPWAVLVRAPSPPERAASVHLVFRVVVIEFIERPFVRLPSGAGLFSRPA